MTKLYDFKDEVRLDVKDYVAKHREINPIDNLELAYKRLTAEFKAVDYLQSEIVNDTIYEVLTEMVNDIDDETYERIWGKKIPW